MRINDEIKVDDRIYLTGLGESDAYWFVEHLAEKEISDNTLMIPYPYKREDALWFLNFSKAKQGQGPRLDWAIRNEEEQLIGMISFHGDHKRGTHRDEVGYWLAKPYWGKGIMTKTLKKFCEMGFNEYGYVRLEAPIFAFNKASQRVAEKCGFQLEGLLKKAYLKNAKYYDGVLYALVK